MEIRISLRKDACRDGSGVKAGNANVLQRRRQRQVIQLDSLSIKCCYRVRHASDYSGPQAREDAVEMAEGCWPWEDSSWEMY